MVVEFLCLRARSVWARVRPAGPAPMIPTSAVWDGLEGVVGWDGGWDGSWTVEEGLGRL